MATNNNARSENSRSENDGEKGALPAFNVAVEIAKANGKTRLFRAGGLWPHSEGGGLGGNFVDTRSGREVRLVLFTPKDGEYQSKRAPAYKIFVDHTAPVEGSDETTSELIFVGLAWNNTKGGFGGHIITDTLSGTRLHILCMPPKSSDD